MVTIPALSASPPSDLPHALLEHHPPHPTIPVPMPPIDSDLDGQQEPARVLKFYHRPGDAIAPDAEICDIEVIVSKEMTSLARKVGGKHAEEGQGLVFTMQSEDAGVMGPRVLSKAEGCPNGGRVEAGQLLCEIWQTADEAGVSDENEREALEEEEREEKKTREIRAKREGGQEPGNS